MRRTQRNSDEIPALILSVDGATPGLDINSLTLSRSLGRRGIPVYRFHNSISTIDTQSKYCTPVLCPNAKDEPEALFESLVDFAKQTNRHPVVFPTGDDAALFLTERREELKPWLSVCVADQHCIETIIDKPRLYDVAQRAGIAVPDTFTPSSLEEMRSTAASIEYPAVLKPRSSHHWKRDDVRSAIGSVKAIRADNQKTLIGAYERIVDFAPEVMVQEIIPGPDDLLLTFLGYVNRAGEPLGGCVRKKLRQSPPGFGLCCLTETVADSEVFESSTRLLRLLDYHGLVSVEFKRVPRDGSLKLIEINTRIARTTGLAVGAGVDLPYIAYLDLIGANPSPCMDYEVGVRWIALIDEFLAARELIGRGELTLRNWMGIFRGKLIFGDWALDDPRPFLTAARQVLAKGLRGSLGRSFRWRRETR